MEMGIIVWMFNQILFHMYQLLPNPSNSPATHTLIQKIFIQLLVCIQWYYTINYPGKYQTSRIQRIAKRENLSKGKSLSGK